ncbi:MAG: hypothetical protein KGJ87_03625 [Planctomycetota bacterium]|nr:hypothetical protein [Planctomycetota bacterium]MDE1889625.1 hypothetical protein [Planctomycetota bacterium]MDE2216240.1 hypothetical protein [Planctomycetota bacterium]
MTRAINLLCLLLAVAWLARTPDWEPAIAVITFLGALIVQELFTGLRFIDRDAVDRKLGSFQRRMEKAESLVCISGNDCKFVVESSSAAIDDLLNRGLRLRLLLTDPETGASEMLARMDPRFTEANQFRDSMTEVIRRLESWRKKWHKQFEYRLLPILPAFGFFITDPHTDHGTVKIELYSAKQFKPINSRPHIILGRGAGKWRAYFVHQWENYWSISHAP